MVRASRSFRRAVFDERSLAESFETLRNDFKIAKESRFQSKLSGVSLSGTGADYHYRSETSWLRSIEQAREFDRNNMVVGQGVNRLCDNVVQDGFTLDPQTGSDELDAALWDKWQEWASDARACHAAGKSTWPNIEWLALRHLTVDGDMLGLPLESGQLETVEAHRLRTPRNTRRNVVHGVLTDDLGAAKEYWVTKLETDPMRPVTRVNEIKPYKALDDEGFLAAFHVFNPTRFSQTRGITAFAPISDPVGMHDDIQFATLVKQQMASCVTIFHEFAEGADESLPPQRGEREDVTLPDGSTRRQEGLSPGLDIYGQPGEKLQGFTPNVPNPEFFQHALLILSIIAVNLNLPVAVLLLDPSKTNFSGWRGAIDQARLTFQRLQADLIARLHRPVYVWKVRQWLVDDPKIARLAGDGGSLVYPLRHAWQPPAWSYIEPVKDATGDLLQLRGALTSPRRLHARRGNGDWQVLCNEMVEDFGYAIRRAKKEAMAINKEFDDGHPVHWRECVSLPTPEGIKITLNTGGSDKEDEPADTDQPDKPDVVVVVDRRQKEAAGA